MRITINDIAKRLNVSANTVSKALNGKAKVSEALRQTVLETAAAMGYEKNRNASRLSQKPLHIGVLINGYDENYYRYTQQGLARAAEYLVDKRVTLTVKTVKAQPGDAEALATLRAFLSAGLDGVIVNDVTSPSLLPLLEDFRTAGIRVALLNYDIPKAARSFAVINDHACAAGMAAELLTLGLPCEAQLWVYAHGKTDGVSTQRRLAECFRASAAALGFRNVRVTADEKELFGGSPAGVYVSHASYLNVCRWAEQLPADRRPRLVVSDLYEAGVPYLENGTVAAVIDQAPEEQAFRAAVTLYEQIGEGIAPEEILSVTPVVVLKSNCRKYLP